MRSATTSALCIALLGALSIASRASAHVVTRGIGTAIVLAFQKDKVTFTYDLGFGAIYARNAMLTVDTDRDFVVSDEEANRYLEDTWEKTIQPKLKVKLDGRDMPYRVVAKRAENLAGEIAALPFDLYYDVEVEIPYASRDERRKTVRLEIINEALKNQTTNVPLFYIPYLGHTNEVSYKLIEPPALLDLQTRIAQGEALTVEFDFAMGDRLEGRARFLSPGAPTLALVTDPPTPEAPESPGPADPNRGEGPALSKPPVFVDDEDEQGPGLEALVQDFMKPGATLWVMITLLFTAFFYGMGHALTPGHGKAMVAAYLVGTKGRIRDAVILGSVTTFTHTFSIFLLGILIYVVLEGTSNTETLKNWTVAGFSLLGCLILVVMGLVLFARRWSWAGHPEKMQEAGKHHHHGLFGHSHGHGHDQGHQHEHEHQHGHEHGHEHQHGHQHEHEHQHGHEPEGGVGSPDDVHPHDHAHAVSSEKAPKVSAGTDASTPRLGELLTLGIASGIAPCPGGMYIIGLGLLYPERFLFALLLILVFCLGLGAVLIAIGVVLVTGRAHLLRRFGGHGHLKFISYLPAASALFVAGVGSFFMVVYFIKYKPEVASMLSAFSEWLRTS